MCPLAHTCVRTYNLLIYWFLSLQCIRFFFLSFPINSLKFKSFSFTDVWIVVKFLPVFVGCSYLIASMGLQVVWSFGLACLDLHALRSKRSLQNPILVSLFVVGDWVSFCTYLFSHWFLAFGFQKQVCVASLILRVMHYFFMYWRCWTNDWRSFQRIMYL